MAHLQMTATGGFCGRCAQVATGHEVGHFTGELQSSLLTRKLPVKGCGALWTSWSFQAPPLMGQEEAQAFFEEAYPLLRLLPLGVRR